jgi:signal transduction histidine kinase
MKYANTASIQTKLLSYGVAIILCFAVINYYLIKQMHEQTVERVYQSLEVLIPKMITLEIDEKSHSLISFIKIIKNHQELENTFLNNDRESFETIFDSLFKELYETETFNQINVYTPDLISVLQHSSLKNEFSSPSFVSSTLLKAQQTRRITKGVEITSNGHFVITVVYPWYIGQKLVGFIKLNQDIKHIIEEISLNTVSNLVTLIDKKNIDKDIWENHDHHRAKEINWHQLKNEVIIDSAGFRADQYTKQIKLIEAALNSRQEVHFLDIENSHYVFGSQPIVDINDNVLGKIVFIHRPDELIKQTNSLSQTLFLSIIGVGLFLISIYTFFIHKIEQQQTRLFTDLQNVIQQQEKTEKDLTRAKYVAELANRSKSEFLASMSHEFRTPLNSILGFTQLMTMKKESFEKEDIESLNYIENSGKHLLSLINDVLNLEQIESGNITLKLTEVNLYFILTSVSQSCMSIAQKYSVSVKLADDIDQQLYALVDEQRLKQILFNFVSNAIKYNVRGGQVIIDARKSPNNKVRISVIDTGTGVKNSDLEKIFQPFNRSEKSKSNIEGSGIGLTICSRLADLMHGTIGAENNANKGMTFWVEFDAAS